VLRRGPILIFALRLDVGRWEPLYATIGARRMGLSSSFSWTVEAVCVLEAAVFEREPRT